MAATEAQKRATARFVKKNVKQVNVPLNIRTDADILAWLDKQPSKLGAIKAACREKMEREA